MNDYINFNGGFKLHRSSEDSYTIVTDFLDNLNDGIFIVFDLETGKFSDNGYTSFNLDWVDNQEKLFDEAINRTDVVFEVDDGELSSKDPMALLQTIIRAYAIADYVQGDEDE